MLKYLYLTREGVDGYKVAAARLYLAETMDEFRIKSHASEESRAVLAMMEWMMGVGVVPAAGPAVEFANYCSQGPQAMRQILGMQLAMPLLDMKFEL